jgi:SAM-dependent methyltransferase
MPEPIGPTDPVMPKGWHCSHCGHQLPISRGIPLTAPKVADTVTGIDPAAFSFLAEAEREHFWFVPRRRLIVALLSRFAPQAKSFAEIGAGTGNVIGEIMASRSWRRLLATEIHPSGLSIAAERLGPMVETLQLDARTITFAEAFDAIGAFDVLEHIEEDEAAISQIHRALTPSGVFIATVPQHPFLWSAADDVAHHQRRYRRGELETKLRHHGFEILFSSSYNAILLPLMTASHLQRRGHNTSKADAPDLTSIRREFNVSPLVNVILKTLLAAETFLTARGMRWPAGGSRVVVARRQPANTNIEDTSAQ